MKLTIELSESLVRKLLVFIEDDDELKLDSQAPFDDFVEQLLESAIEARKRISLTDEEIAAVVNRMLEHALNGDTIGATFQTNQLYASATGNLWTKIEPSVRKSIGKRFRAAVEAHTEKAVEGDRVISLMRRNINNAAVYELSIVPTWEPLP